MTVDIKLPVLGENIDSGTVVRILVKEGDTISKDQPVVEIDTEKASVDVPSSASGTVKEIRAHEGEVLKVGQVILTLEQNGQGATTRKDRKDSPPEKQEKQTQAPDEDGPGAANGAANEASEPSAQAEEGEAEKSATPEEEITAHTESPAKKEAPGISTFKTSASTAPASPSLRRMARELGIDIDTVTGTGPSGRISEADIRNHARSIILNASTESSGPRETLPDFQRWGDIERKPLSGIRRTTAEHMQDAWLSIPHVTHFDSADITELEQFRQHSDSKAGKAGGKPTLTAILLKVAAAALRKFPDFNTTLDSMREEIVYKKYIHIGVAVDTPHGLLVPVIRNVDQKSILELSTELKTLAEKARTRKVTIEEMQGGTFTITNVGGIGGTNFTPIVNNPEVAILGVARAVRQPVWIDGEFKPRMMLPLALSFDHRVVDGAAGARFLRWIAQALEQPFMMAFEV